MKLLNSCYIIGAGDFSFKNFHPHKNDMIICADGGYDKIDTKKYNVSYVIGDNDSISIPQTLIPNILYKSEKDETDMDLAVRKAIDLGFEKIKIFGGYGDRPDHFFANIQLMARYSKQKINIVLYADNFIAVCLNNQKIHFKKTDKDKTISIFSLDNTTDDVCIKGLKYEIKNANLTNDFALGVSNQSIGTEAIIQSGKGMILIISYDEIANNNYEILDIP